MAKKKYLYEVDLMRCMFIFMVLLNHTTSLFSATLGQSSTGAGRFLVTTHLMLHFPRFGFMFVTGLVLFLQYYHKDHVNWWQFWKKRYKGSGIPYLVWNLVFMGGMLAGAGALTFSNYANQSLEAILHGSQFYLYYIMVVMQLYLIFPLLITLFKKLPNHHGAILITSGLLQLAFLIYAKYIYPELDTSGWPYFFKYYGVNVLSYQFYFIAGGYTSIHYPEVKEWLLSHTRFIYWGTAAVALGTLGLYWFDTAVLNLGQHRANLIHQPYMLIYAFFTISLVIIVSLKYAAHRTEPAWQPFAKAVGLSSKVSFGIYLVQTIPLTILSQVLAALKNVVSPGLILGLLPIGYLFVLGTSWLIAFALMKIPPFGVLVGRPNHRVLIQKEGVLNDQTN